MSKYNFRKDFSPMATQVVEHAIIECMRMMHSYVGKEHLLLGLLMASDGEASKLLTKQAISLNRARNQVDLMHGPRGYMSLEPLLKASAKHALYLAWQHAMLAGSASVETEHILLAILKKEGNKDAIDILKLLQVDIGLLEANLMKLLESKRSGNNFARRLSRPDEENGESHD
ncbi:MAG: hypothetical protein K2Y22_14610 [Candidatus Obscuribacterales bacterium]|nr:hypothetical protein [Candidatus Obscuribacterales bacterium]